MKILAAVCLTLGLITAYVDTQPHSITTASTATSSKPTKAVAIAASDVLSLSILPAAFHTVITPSTDRRSVDSTFPAHQKSIGSLPKRARAAEPLSAPVEHRPNARSLSGKKKAGGFLKTCAPNWVVWELNSAIWAHCRGSGERRGSVFWSRIGLDHMLGNDHGQLVYQQDGGFSLTCLDCKRWGTAHLACRCLDGRGDLQATSINLDKYIGNYDGLLCSEYECGAREAPPP
ncbi:Cyanovirin-N [Colletotrichum eremochloae]|nr:Cyanovirin-N [Colletotrichum eremochloae]